LNDLIFPGHAYSALAEDLLRHDEETCAIASTKSGGQGNCRRILVREVRIAPDDTYLRRGALEAVLKPEYVAWVTAQARKADCGLVFIHSHPRGIAPPQFSPIDDSGEQALAEFLRRRIPGRLHAALVVSTGGCQARLLATSEEMRVAEVGTQLRFPASRSGEFDSARFDRQVLAFGEKGQQILSSLRVGIVGLGGTGSIIAQQLCYLGVSNFLLIDPESVDETNLNRLVGANGTSVGKPKVAVIEEHLRAIRPNITVRSFAETVLDAPSALRLLDTDFVFCCTDSHGSRAVLNQLAYQYYLPCLDVGVSIAATNGVVTHVTGRTQLLAPGLGCLVCGELLDGDRVRWDLMSQNDRSNDPYFIGEGLPQPSVISLNSTVVSLAVTMFLGATTGIPAHARYQLYNGIAGTVRILKARIEAACIVCSRRGAMGRGDEWALPARPARSDSSRAQ
jgi:Dinucleotide-utilizing enzymes involved in molybdopterin and thiamine biosynthesis family 2